MVIHKVGVAGLPRIYSSPPSPAHRVSPEPGNEARPKKVVQLWRQMLSATEAATSNTAQEPTDAFSGRH
ncbi:Trafficking Protein Particle Complex Subunit 9 [Manis pentadactyla]|nr:Trafficking Protein Particle Complex Subunit 9 [Manis pentadactyla]